jgi:hypothetical protein
MAPDSVENGSGSRVIDTVIELPVAHEAFFNVCVYGPQSQSKGRYDKNGEKKKRACAWHDDLLSCVEKVAWYAEQTN